MSVMRVIVLHPYTKFEVLRFPFGRHGAFSVSALICLVTLTFDLSICKWGSRITRHGLRYRQFSACCSLPSRRMVRHGTDGQTDDDHQRLMQPPCRDGDIIKKQERHRGPDYDHNLMISSAAHVPSFRQIW